MRDVTDPPSSSIHGQPSARPILPASSGPEASTLLPPMLGAPSAFLWLWVLPIAILLGLNIQGYWLVEGNMTAIERGRALALGAANAVNLAAGIALYGIARAFVARGASATANLVVR